MSPEPGDIGPVNGAYPIELSGTFNLYDNFICFIEVVYRSKL